MPFALVIGNRCVTPTAPADATFTPAAPPTADSERFWNQRLASNHCVLVAHQPARLLECQSGEGRRLWLAFDGFLTGRDSPCAETALRGSNPNSDIKRIAQWIRDRGIDALETLEGNFALVVVDPDQGRFRALRDTIGARALYHARFEGGLAFASRSSVLARLPGVGGEENPQFIARMFGLKLPPVPGTTPFARVSELRPGELLSGNGNHSRSTVTTLAFRSNRRKQSRADTVNRFRTLFQAAVAAAIEPGATAVMLSGGMDSGPIAVATSRAAPDSADGATCISWEVPDYPDADESHWTRMLSEALPVRHEHFDGSAMLPFGDLTPEAVNPDLPALNAFRPLVSECYRRAAARQCRVVLNGNMGDQLYPAPYLGLFDLVRRLRLADAWARLRALAGESGWAALKKNPEFRYLGRRMLGMKQRGRRGPGPAPHAMLTAEALSLLNHGTTPREECRRHPLPPYAEQLLGPWMAFGPAQEAANAEQYGLERREPFQNPALIRFMLETPVALSHHQGQDKWIMREAMRGRMPEAFRVKGRTGLLHGFFDAGFDAHRQHLRELLQADRAWERFVEAGPIEAELQGQTTDRMTRMLIGQCAAYVLWRRHWS